MTTRNNENRKTAKRNRTIRKRPTFNQKETILNYMEKHADFANNRNKIPYDDLEVWGALTKQLNNMDGTFKCEKNWKKCWSDMKKYARSLKFPYDKSSAEINLNKKPLPIIEQRILALLAPTTEESNSDVSTELSSEASSEANIENDITYIPEYHNTRASEIQKLELVKYFEDHPESVRKLAGHNGKVRQRIWIELTHRLNMLEGTMKSSSKWAKYWADLIIYTKNRARSVIDKNTKIIHTPREIDKRILHIIGQNHLLEEWKNNLNKSEILEHSLESNKEIDNFLTDPLFQNINRMNSTLPTEIEDCLEPEYLLEPVEIKSNDRRSHFYDEKKIKFDDLKNLLDRVIDDDEKIQLKDVPETLFAISDALSSLSELVNRAALAVTKIKSERN